MNRETKHRGTAGYQINLSDHYFLLLIIARELPVSNLQYNTGKQHPTTELLLLCSGQQGHKEKGTASLTAP